MMNGTTSLLIQTLPLILLTIPLGVVTYLLSKQKGRNSLAITILAFVPFVGFYLMIYFVGATNRFTELKLEEIYRSSGRV